jgi:hypothetical protein
MKKILAILVLLSAVLVMVAPAAVVAQEELPSGCTIKHNNIAPNCPTKGSQCNYATSSNICGLCCTLDTIYTVSDWVFTVFIVIVVLFAILGAMSILTSAGDPGKVQTGRNYILYAAVGLAVAFLARAVPALVKAMMGIS